MAEKANTPAIRFRGFTDAWEQRKLGEITDSYSGGTPSVGVKEYYGGEIPFIRSAEINSDSTELFITQKGLDNSSARIANIGDILYALYGATSGEVGRARLKGAVNQAIMVIQPHTEYYSEFLVQWLRKSKQTIIDTYLQGGQGNLSGAIVKDLVIDCPSQEEQQQIGTFFRSLDNLITLHQRKYEKLRNIKKACLEKMFPKAGSNVPEIRFRGFTGDWVRREFGDMAEYKKGPFGSALKKELFVPDGEDSVKVYEQQNAINKDWKLERYYITKSYANELNAFETHAGDIIISCAGTIGEMYELPPESRAGVINQALMRVRVNERTICKSIYKLLFLNMIESFSKEHSNGSAMKNIPPFADLKPMTAMVPSLNEQQQLSTFFGNLDNLITLHQRKLEKLRNLKKACLEKMFV
ncbi:MAG: restriction endonuclease subunit S [Eubacteriaceae bacterium]|nr:restriction endonuclease subunit S [Eubacteriaceae bacterium]